MKNNASISTLLVTAISFAALSLGSMAHAQTIVWSSANTITGDADLVTSGTSYDAFLTNTNLNSPITVDGITFNPALVTSGTSTSGTDGVISFTVNSGDSLRYSPSGFSAPGASAAFASLMNSGGLYSDNSGTGTVSITGLTVGDIYSVQAFEFATDGDALGDTISFDGANSVTLNDGGNGVSTGQYATGLFTAATSTETFDWSGPAGTPYTPLGPISVEDMGAAVVPEPSTYALMLGGVLLLVIISRNRRQSQV